MAFFVLFFVFCFLLLSFFFCLFVTRRYFYVGWSLFSSGCVTEYHSNNAIPSFLLAQSSPRDLQIVFFSCVIEIMLLCENCGSVPRASREWFHIFSWSKERRLNNKTIIELVIGYLKISCQCLAYQIFASAFGFGK